MKRTLVNTRHIKRNIKLAMTAEEKIKGPASYFPSIEKTYGQPIEYWLSLVSGLNAMKHMEMVQWLKAEHKMGHGHANAIVAYVLAKTKNNAVT